MSAGSCPICGDGPVLPKVVQIEQTYGGHSALVETHVCECEACSSEFSGIAESKKNKRLMMAFRKRVDGLLSGENITAIRSKYGITQEQASRIYGGGAIAFTKYENDDVAQSASMDALLRLTRQNPAIFKELVEMKGMRDEIFGKNRTSSIEKVVIKNTDLDKAEYTYNPKEFRVVESGDGKNAKSN